MNQHKVVSLFRNSERWITARSLARRMGVSRDRVDDWCRGDRFVGARFDRLTWQWLVRLPVRVR